MQCQRFADETVKKLIGRRTFQCLLTNRRGLLKAFWVKFERWQDRVKKIEREKRDMLLQRIYIGGGMYLTPEKPEDMLPRKHPLDETKEDIGALTYDLQSRHWMLRYLDWSPQNIMRYKRYQRMISRQYDQRFVAERHLFLGSDLAAAHFLLHRGGAVKFVGDDKWHKRDENDDYFLPGSRVPGMYVEGVDASNTEIMFEGLDNLIDLHKLRFLSLADCKYINDWCMGKMPQFERSLEFLDLSNCSNVTAKGLSGLACLKKLKYLRLEGFDRAKDVAKVVLQLEEAIPGLEVVGVEYDAALEQLQKEERLLSHENVVQDAKGNLYAKDSAGELYYLYGDYTERQVLDDDDDMPILVNKIRKDPPALPLETVEELNLLSEGKLKHLLAGSPSGEWSQETERVLEVEAKRLLDNGHVVHPFLMPEDKTKIRKQLAKLKALETKKYLEAKQKLLLDTSPV